MIEDVTRARPRAAREGRRKGRRGGGWSASKRVAVARARNHRQRQRREKERRRGQRGGGGGAGARLLLTGRRKLWCCCYLMKWKEDGIECKWKTLAPPTWSFRKEYRGEDLVRSRSSRALSPPPTNPILDFPFCFIDPTMAAG